MFGFTVTNACRKRLFVHRRARVRAARLRRDTVVKLQTSPATLMPVWDATRPDDPPHVVHVDTASARIVHGAGRYLLTPPPQTARPYPCPCCPFRGRTRDEVVAHREQWHTEPPEVYVAQTPARSLWVSGSVPVVLAGADTVTDLQQRVTEHRHYQRGFEPDGIIATFLLAARPRSVQGLPQIAAAMYTNSINGMRQQRGADPATPEELVPLAGERPRENWTTRMPNAGPIRPARGHRRNEGDDTG